MTPLSSLKAPRLPLWSGSLLTAFVFCYGRPRAAVDGAIMPATRRPTGRELGGLLQSSRRMTAAPSRVRDVAFSFVVRTHGLIAPVGFSRADAVREPFGVAVSLNAVRQPARRRPPLGGCGRLLNLVQGIHHE